MISSGLALSLSATLLIIPDIAIYFAMTSRPVMASMRRTPEATEPSEVMTNIPTLAVLSRCVPPQNSIEKSPIFTTLTVSPYFSPKSDIALSFFASSKGITCVSISAPSRIISAITVLTWPISSAVSAEKWVKSKRRWSGSTREPA